ncbi:UNVERIFIED_CONTAM: Auxilin-like protein 1 [Sesamum radiatum]|uniref:Auxilin-like protein 1 n=1 Tax=Sesamum radiatum TaxID=300843 RepID=A0AAW2QE03_SESRA
MESVSRPPHRRKHSTANAFSSSSSSFSFKNPYDDVVLSKGGKVKFGAHEYAEMFSGSSSIPVLDLSGLDERVESADCRSSKLDYTNIFGGFRDDDVAVPYDELVNAAAKKAKTRSLADAQSRSQESAFLHSPGKAKKLPHGASDQSNEGTKQHFNLSFNKTGERNTDVSNGKTHVAQLNAVPGFTYFVDGTPQLQKTEGDRSVPLLKREVSRTWSFSAGIEAVTVKGGVSWEKSYISDKSCNVNDTNTSARISKMPPSSSHPSNPNDNKDARRSRLPSFASKDASGEAAGECSPPLFEEELDENSVAAVSAAALKKAIEQAQESIRIAKMIMERKKEGLQDGSKPRSEGRLKVKYNKETRLDREANGHSEKLLNAGKAEVSRVRDNDGAAKEHGDAFSGEGQEFAPSCSQRETVNIAEKDDLKNIGQNLEAAEAGGEGTKFSGLGANAECTTATPKSDNGNLVCSTNKLGSHLEEMETSKEIFEHKELNCHQPEGPEVLAERAERAPNTSQRAGEVEKSVDESLGQCQATTHHIAELLEGVHNFSQSTQEQEKIVHEAGENLRTRQEDEVTEERDIVDDDEEKCEKKFMENEEMVHGEHFTVLSSEFNNLLNESRDLSEKDMLEHKDIEAKSENGLHGRSSDGAEDRVMQKEAHTIFESEQQLKESLTKEISEGKPETFPEVEVGEKVNVVHESEIDDRKLNHGRKLPGEDEQNEIADIHMETSEFEAAENIPTEANGSDEVQNSDVPSDSGETNDIHRGATTSEENQDKFGYQEVATEKDIDEAVDAHSNDSGTIFGGTHNDTSTIFGESQEPSDVHLNNKAEEYKAAAIGYEMNDNLPGVTETFSTIENKEAGRQFHLEVGEMPGTDSLRRCASEENFIGSKLNNTVEGLSSDSKTETDSSMNASNEETLPEDEDTCKPANEIHNAAQESAPKVNMQNLPEVHPSDNKAAEFDQTNVRPVLERTTESKEESESTSIPENIGVSAHESRECEENMKESTSNREAVRDDLDMISDQRENVEDQSTGVYSEDRSEEMNGQSNNEPKEMDKSMETETGVETGQNMGNNDENLRGKSTMEQKDAKGNDKKSETDDPRQRIEAIKRGREREKDRIAVERAIREARERAFAEARERAERAAVERAAAEARQRVMAEAREKLEKASVETKQSADKASTEAKLRAERAAVERATAEARERALEKAMSQKTSVEPRTQAERNPAERFSSSSRNNGLKHSFSSSDLEKFDGTASESAQRRKARLERHQRIMERAAKALAEKNMRDLLAQKEQAERNRLAESLDADIKRWATGKEGNLRALLSTLQYILGPESGWQPISLTEIITTAAVKKAYRKATLCVHPDKLQQRGASIQQKYICEKVFDLLKAAWKQVQLRGKVNSRVVAIVTVMHLCI